MHKEFSTLSEGNLALENWIIRKKADVVIIESTNVNLKTLQKALARVGVKVVVINPRHV
jgi:spore coat polysaccharide biosynthesis predicted glycosyltransferase SpsG